jgi:hypothetical protein
VVDVDSYNWKQSSVVIGSSIFVLEGVEEELEIGFIFAL